MAQIPSTNPFLESSRLPFGAFPFDKIKNEHFVPALDAGLKEARANIDKIRSGTADDATFENTIVALETASEAVGRVSSIFFNLLGSNSDDELQAMAREISPKLAEFSSDVLLDAKIFARVKAVWEKRSILTGEDLRLTEKSYKDFARNGGLLDVTKKAQLRDLDQEMAKLAPLYSDNVLKATNDFKLWITNTDELRGVPESAIEGYALAAKEAGAEASAPY